MSAEPRYITISERGDGVSMLREVEQIAARWKMRLGSDDGQDSTGPDLTNDMRRLEHLATTLAVTLT